ncbi:hypothetical protein [Streptomyces sp. NPDC092903]|uniref:hypothetical protein n=1 Tax=Streptomyces sp. NPDC092903 TaxID=3366017 RepID=UPI0038027306
MTHFGHVLHEAALLTVPYGDSLLPVTLAFRAIVQLNGCTPITTDDLEAAV